MPNQFDSWMPPGALTQWIRDNGLSARGQQTARPASLLDPSFVYVPSNKTDVRATWARFGFKPKGE